MKKSAPGSLTLALLRSKHRLRKLAAHVTPSRQKTALFALAFALLGLFIWVITTHGPLAAVKVTTEKVQLGKLTPNVLGIGSIEARHSYNVSSVTTGRISKMLVDQGSIVKIGQLVAEIDPVDLDEKLASSHLLSERAANFIKVAEAQLMEAQSRNTTATSTYARFTDLQRRGFVSQELLDGKLHEKNAANASFDAATANLTAARRDHQKSLSDALGMTKLHQQTHLISPINGIVFARLVENGSILAPGQTALQIVDPADIWIKARIDQQQAGLLQTGQKTEIMLRSRPQTPFTGKVERIDLISDSVTEERIVNIAFTGANSVLNLGEQAEVIIQLPVIEQTRSVAAAATKHINQQTGVWLLINGRSKFRAVQTGITTRDGRTQIISGLKDHDEVIVYSEQAMQDGLKVKVLSELVRN